MTCRFILTIAAVLIVLGPIPKQAEAQLTKCLKRETVVNNLKENHNENVVSYGLTKNGVVLEIFASPGGSWTAIFSYPIGWSCAIASGDNWTVLPTINDDEKGQVL